MYEQYNLKLNPFTDPSHDYPIIDRVATRDVIKEKLPNYIGSKSPAIIPVIGDYGVGKTYFLRFVEKKISDKSFFDEKKGNLLASYITAIFPKPPSNYIHYIYSESVKRIGFEKFRELVDDLHKLQNKENLLKEFHSDFRNALLNFKIDEHIAWEYLSGETITRDEASAIDIKKSIRDNEQSLNAVLNFLRFLHIINYKSFIFLIDEFEYLFAKGSKQGAQFLNTFRFLYDRALEILSDKGNIANPIFLVACSPLTWDQIYEDASSNVLGTKPFVDRAIPKITIPPFNKNETKDLILGRLEKWRIDKNDRDRIGIFPFIEGEKNNTFDLITKINRGLPRLILRNTATILDKACERNFEKIGFKEIEIIGKELGLIRKENHEILGEMIKKDKNLFQI